MRHSHTLQKLIVDRLFPEIEVNGGNETARRSIRQLSSKLEGIEALEKLMDNPSPYETPAAHARRVDQAAKALSAQMEKLLPEIAQNLARERVELAAQIEHKAGLTPTAKGEEIRSVLRGLNEADRHKAVRKALEQSDTDTLSAIHNVGELLTGIAPEHAQRYISEHKAKVAPSEHLQISALNEFESRLPTIADLFSRATSEAVDPSERAAADKAEQAAGEATMAMNNALGSV